MTKIQPWHREARELFRRGYTNDQIAKKLGLADETIRSVTKWVRLNEGRSEKFGRTARGINNSGTVGSQSFEVDHHINLMEVDAPTRAVASELRYWNSYDD